MSSIHERPLFVASVYKPFVGGVETTIDSMAAELTGPREQLNVFTKRYPAELPEIDIIGSSKVVRIPIPLSGPDFLNSMDWLKRHQRAMKADVVHIIGIRRHMPLYGLLLSRLWQVPYIVTFAGGDLPNPKEPASVNLWGQGKQTVPQSVMQADYLTTYSRYTRNLANKSIPGLANIKVVYAGINLEKIQSAESPDISYNYFFSARRLHDSKGIDVLIRAFVKAARQLENTKLLIAGDGPRRAVLENMAFKSEIANRIVFLGEIPQEEVFSYMRGALSHICPSRTEGGGIVNFESQAAGCLTIGSDAGGIPEYIKHGETGLIFPSEDVGQLAGLLVFSARDSEAKRKIIRQAKEGIGNFTWAGFSNQYSRTYSHLIQNYTPRPFEPWSELTRAMWERLNS